jgi:hypothetical protein
MANGNKSGFGGVPLFAALHFLCCGIPLLILSGVSLAFLRPAWPIIGSVLAVAGVVGFIWYLKRGCATCPGKKAAAGWRKGRCVSDGRSKDIVARPGADGCRREWSGVCGLVLLGAPFLVAGLVSAIGLGFILKDSILMGLLVVFLGVAGLGLYLARLRSRKRRASRSASGSGSWATRL